MEQTVQSLIDAIEGFLLDKRLVLMDHDANVLCQLSDHPVEYRCPVVFFAAAQPEYNQVFGMVDEKHQA